MSTTRYRSGWGRTYGASDRLPDSQQDPPEDGGDQSEPRNPEIDEDQLASLQVSPDGSGWMASRLGTLEELSADGKADVRWLWDNEPDLREAFGAEPPSQWNPTKD